MRPAVPLGIGPQLLSTYCNCLKLLLTIIVCCD